MTRVLPRLDAALLLRTVASRAALAQDGVSPKLFGRAPVLCKKYADVGMVLPGGLCQGTRCGVEEWYEARSSPGASCGGRASCQHSGSRAGAGRNVGEAGGVNPLLLPGRATSPSSRGDANGVRWPSVSDNVSASDGGVASGLRSPICARAWRARWRRCLVSSRGPGLIASPSVVRVGQETSKLCKPRGTHSETWKVARLFQPLLCTLLCTLLCWKDAGQGLSRKSALQPERNFVHPYRKRLRPTRGEAQPAKPPALQRMRRRPRPPRGQGHGRRAQGRREGNGRGASSIHM